MAESRPVVCMRIKMICKWLGATSDGLTLPDVTFQPRSPRLRGSTGNCEARPGGQTVRMGVRRWAGGSRQGKAELYMNCGRGMRTGGQRAVRPCHVLWLACLRLSVCLSVLCFLCPASRSRTRFSCSMHSRVAGRCCCILWLPESNRHVGGIRD